MPIIEFLAAAIIALLSGSATLTGRLSLDESSLAHALQGRIPGKPRNCVSLRLVPSNRVVAGTAIIFEAGNTLYVNRPSSGAESLSERTALLTKTPTGEICSGEAVRLIDSSSGTATGVIFLGKFVPYRKVVLDRPYTVDDERPRY